ARATVAAGLRVDEVGDGGSGRLETVAAEDLLQLRAAGGVRAAAASRLLLVGEARERPRLRRCGDVERAPDLRNLGHDLRGTDAVADAQPGEPVDLRERAQDDHAAAAAEVLRDPVGILGIV